MEQSIELLGPLRVVVGAEQVRLGGAKERGLLALLALRAGRVAPFGALIDGLWGEEPPDTAQNTLQVYVSHLRRVLGRAAIGTEPVGYRLAVDPQQVDAVRFERLVGAGRSALERGEPDHARELLRAGLDLWRGDALAGCGQAPGLAAEAVRLEELRLVAVEDEFAAGLESGRHAELVPALRTLVAGHPFREQLRMALLLALHRAGRTAEALAAYEATRRLWADELGLDPSPKLQRLHRAILGEDSVVEAPAASPARGWTAPPVPPTVIVGRDGEVAALRRALTDPAVRLVTVLGTGGVGKTRLALEVARLEARGFPDGVCWVPLAAVRDPGHVPTAIAQAVGVRHPEGPDLTERVCAVLRRRRLLMLVDNTEHLPGVEAVVADLIAGAPELTVLVTSRTALRLAAEHRVPIQPLAVPAAVVGSPAPAAGIGSPAPEPEADPAAVLDAPAAALFWTRARAVDPALALTPANAAAVAALCARLDGLPLAIELAAARVNVLSPTALLARLDRRLALLTAGSRDAAQRHHSLRATLAWSHDLLGPAERDLFARLAVCRGGATLEAAEAVASDTGLDVLDGLAALVDASLITRTDDHAGGSRFGMLETIREYAAEQLTASGQEAIARLAHASYYAGFVSAGRTSIPRAPGNAGEARRLDREQENLRAALEWTAGAGHQALFADLACCVTGRWLRVGLGGQAESWLTRVVADPPSPARHIDALYWLAHLRWMAGEAAESVRLIREAIRLAAADPARLASCLGSLAFYLGGTGEGAEATATSTAAVELARQACDPGTLACVLNDAACGQVDAAPDLARQLLDEAAVAARRADDDMTLANVANNLGEVALGLGDADTAQRSAEGALRLALVGENPHLRTFLIDIVASALLIKGDLSRAEVLLAEALRMSHQLGDLGLLTENAFKLGVLAACRGGYRRAAVLREAYQASLRRGDLTPTPGNRYLAGRFLADLDERLAPDELTAARAEGDRLNPAELVRYALRR